EVEAWLRLELDEQVVGFAAGRDDGGDLARLHLLDRDGVVDVDKLGMDPQPLEHDRAGGGGAPALRAQADLLALQVLERRYLRPSENVEFAHEQLGDVVDPLIDVFDAPGFLHALHTVGIGDGYIDTLEIEKVIDVLVAPVAYDRQDSEVFSIIQPLRQFD